MSQITTHILDTTKGKPAADVDIVLYRHLASGWDDIARGTTNKDGRVANLLPDEMLLPVGIYKLKFEITPYFQRLGMNAFYPFVEIVFEVNSEEHYHVPLLLNPFGYSTYRGS